MHKIKQIFFFDKGTFILSFRVFYSKCSWKTEEKGKTNETVIGWWKILVFIVVADSLQILFHFIRLQNESVINSGDSFVDCKTLIKN